MKATAHTKRGDTAKHSLRKRLLPKHHHTRFKMSRTHPFHVEAVPRGALSLCQVSGLLPASLPPSLETPPRFIAQPVEKDKARARLQGHGQAQHRQPNRPGLPLLPLAGPGASAPSSAAIIMA